MVLPHARRCDDVSPWTPLAILFGNLLARTGTLIEPLLDRIESPRPHVAAEHHAFGKVLVLDQAQQGLPVGNDASADEIGEADVAGQHTDGRAGVLTGATVSMLTVASAALNAFELLYFVGVMGGTGVRLLWPLRGTHWGLLFPKDARAAIHKMK